MKKSGIIILLIGLLFTIFTTLGLLIKEHVTDPRKIRITQLKIHNQIWEPLIGSIVVMTGVGLYMIGLRSKVVAKF